MEELKSELKRKLVEALDIHDIDPASIADELPLFEGGLGLDSIDVLELVVMLERDYGIKIESKELGQKVLVSIQTLADFLAEQRAAPAC